MRVVLDTNVLISGLLIPGGPPGKIVDLWTENKITVIVSQALIEEFFDVLLRPKFKRAGTVIERQDLLICLLEMENSVFVFPKVNMHVVKEDPEDNHVLECALEGKVQYIISGDTHLLALSEFQGISIVAPAEFITVFSTE